MDDWMAQERAFAMKGRWSPNAAAPNGGLVEREPQEAPKAPEPDVRERANGYWRARCGADWILVLVEGDFVWPCTPHGAWSGWTSMPEVHIYEWGEQVFPSAQRKPQQPKAE